jgi:hypothetical protein
MVGFFLKGGFLHCNNKSHPSARARAFLFDERDAALEDGLAIGQEAVLQCGCHTKTKKGKLHIYQILLLLFILFNTVNLFVSPRGILGM